MKTSEIAAHLASAATRFPFLTGVNTHDLLALVHAELGDAEALDDFQPYGGHFAKAVGPSEILHIFVDQTPAAALQSLIRGLLLGAHNLCKIPAHGLPEIADFRQALPAELAVRVEINRELPEPWLTQSAAVVVIGEYEVIQRVRSHMKPGQILLAHGPTLSFGVVFEDPELVSAAGAARDVWELSQNGSLPPHVFYVAEDALAYAAKLAAEMERWRIREARQPPSVSEANAIRNRRTELAARVANDEPLALFQSSDAAGWTVVFDPEPGFPQPPLPRFVHVKPLPENLAKVLASVRTPFACAGIWPATLENARRLAAINPARICPLGRMQYPPSTWHQDGRQTLAPLVRWIDAEIY